MTNIPKIYRYGIEITKPWSAEMYKYNESIKKIMQDKILAVIDAVPTEKEAQSLAKIINPYGYGHGYSLADMKADMAKNIEYAENYWFNEIWHDLIMADFVEPIFGERGEVYEIIGFETKEQILELRKQFAQ